MTAVDTLAEWNTADPARAVEMILPCCGSHTWAEAMSRARPISDIEHLLSSASAVWYSLPASAWQQAFDSHPRIGESTAASSHPRSSAWSTTEQAGAQADATRTDALATANRLYEERFGRIFLICASGRSASEILEEATRRMTNTDARELRETAEQQRQITELRLRRWLAEQA